MKYTLSKKQKELFWKLLVEKASADSFGLQKEKEKQGLYLQSFDLNDKTLLILFEANFASGQKQNREHLPLEKKQRFFVLSFSELFVLPSFQNEGSKKQTNKVRSFFFCLSRQQYCCARQWNIFLFHNCPKSTSLWFKKKRQLFFSCLRSWEVTFLQKKCEHQRFVTKSNGQFHFFVTPTHQVMIVITNFNVFEHPPTQV